MIPVRLNDEDFKEPRLSPVTIWIGVFADWTPPTLAYEAAQDLLALLKEYNITDVNVHFRDSIYRLEVGPQLLRPVGEFDPLIDVVGPLTTALGLHISTKARPDAEGTMALYLKKGDDSDNTFGLSCRHVLIDSNEPNEPYVYHRNVPAKPVILLGDRAYTKVVESIKRKIENHGFYLARFQMEVEKCMEMEQGSDVDDAAEATKCRTRAERLVKKSEKAVPKLAALLDRVKKEWRGIGNRVLGHVVHSPPIALGVGQPRFTQDWGLFELDQAKLGDAYQGNKLYLGAFRLSNHPTDCLLTYIYIGDGMTFDEFMQRCLTCGSANWSFTYPYDRLLPLSGTISDEHMRHPNMWDLDEKPCLLVVKSGNGTGTTLGRANGVFSVVRKCQLDASAGQTSMEWAILPYGIKSGPFSAPGDSGSIIADISGRIGGMLTGGSGDAESSDVTYATPWWWLLQQIKATKGFANAYVA
jgi:hypothetical protein